MAQKTDKMKSSDLRDANKQKQYRDESKAKNKKDQHVAHYVSLRIATYFNTFVKPPVPIHTLKQLCNDKGNFRMVKAKTNLSKHNRIDNYLMDSFRNVMLPKIKQDPMYDKLLMTNPCKLEKLMRENKVLCFTLNGNERSRAKAQTRRLQELPFPLKYLAFARLFYRCFQAKRKGHKKHLVQIWDDRKNSEEFKKYLKKQQELMTNDCDENEEQIGNVIKSENRMDDEEEQLNVDDDDANHDDEEKRETENDDLITPKNHRDKTLGKDAKGRQLYQGKRGAVYYRTKSGNKVYVKNTPGALSDDKVEKVVHDHKEQTSEKHQSSSDVNGNAIIPNQDSKGSEPQKLIGNVIESENTTDDEGERLNEDDADHNDIEKKEAENDENPTEKILDKQYKGKKLFVGKRNAIYYKTKSGNKVYVKNTPGALSDGDVEKMARDHKKQKSEEKKSAPDLDENAIVSNQDSKERKRSKQLNVDDDDADHDDEEKRETENDDLITPKNHRDKMLGKDAKGRQLYRGKRGAVYYRTKSGNKIYVKNTPGALSDHEEQTSEKKKSASDLNENAIISNQDLKGSEPSKEQQKSIANMMESENTTDDEEEQLNENDADHNDEEMSDKQYKGKKLFVRKRGAVYYKTKSGNKVYVKKVVHHHEEQNSEEKKPESGMIQDGIVSNQDSEESKSSSKESSVETENDISREDDKESIGVDDKGRRLYKGKKGGVFYKTKSGNRVYIKKK